jgi:hypothetical protein
VRLVELYLRSRLAFHTLAGLGCLALAAWAVGVWVLFWSSADPEVSLRPVLIFAPLVAACVMVTGAYSPFGEVERTVSRSLSALRFFHLAGMVAGTVLALCIVALSWKLGHGGWDFARNLLGLSGMVFLAALFLGNRLAWVAPFSFVVLAALSGVVEREEEEGSSGIAELMGVTPPGEYARLAWTMRPVEDASSWAIVVALVVVGLGVVCVYGARDLSGEEE